MLKIANHQFFIFFFGFLKKKHGSVEYGQHGIGIRNIRSVDLSYFDRKFGVHKGLCKFVPHTLKPYEEDLRIDSRDIIKEAKKNRNFLDSIVTGDGTCCFQYEPETKRQSLEWQTREKPKPKKTRQEK